MQPTFIREPLPKDDVYDGWLTRIDSIESYTMSDDRTRLGHSLDISFQLFPLIDAISYNLFNKNGRHYLKQLGYTDAEADVIYGVFRNGQLHNGNNYRLEYDDGVIVWSMSSSGGTGGFIPYDSGNVDEDVPEANLPAETVFEYMAMPDGTYEASLSLDRLAAQVRHDLNERKATDDRTHIDIIVGQRISGNRRTPSRTYSEDEDNEFDDSFEQETN